MAYADIRTQIKTLLEGVDNIGNVHNRERWADNWSDFLEQFRWDDPQGGDKVRGWMITRVRKALVPGGADGFASAGVDYNNEILIRGIVGFNDKGDSEADVQLLADSIVAVLNSDKNLSDTADVVPFASAPAEVRIIEPRMFGRVLCHYCEIIYRVRTQESF